jgi:hypothetical protein
MIRSVCVWDGIGLLDVISENVVGDVPEDVGGDRPSFAAIDDGSAG